MAITPDCNDLLLFTSVLKRWEFHETYLANASLRPRPSSGLNGLMIAEGLLKDLFHRLIRGSFFFIYNLTGEVNNIHLPLLTGGRQANIMDKMPGYRINVLL